MAKILIAEDDPFLQRAYQIVLTQEGFEVDTASDGVEALKKAEANEPDLILLDVLMPQLGGMEFLRLYDIKAKHPGVKVIVFSNISSPENIKKATELGAVKYLTKASFSPKEMVNLIRETLSS